MPYMENADLFSLVNMAWSCHAIDLAQSPERKHYPPITEPKNARGNLLALFEHHDQQQANLKTKSKKPGAPTVWMLKHWQQCIWLQPAPATEHQQLLLSSSLAQASSLKPVALEGEAGPAAHHLSAVAEATLVQRRIRQLHFPAASEAAYRLRVPIQYIIL